MGGCMAVSLRLERGLPRSANASVERGFPATQGLATAARRGLNVLVALIGVALTWPLMVVIAALIKLTSRGPVLYKQIRIGIDRRSPVRVGYNTRRHFDYGGTPFTIYKFRTMTVDTGAPAQQ